MSFVSLASIKSCRIYSSGFLLILLILQTSHGFPLADPTPNIVTTTINGEARSIVTYWSPAPASSAKDRQVSDVPVAALPVTKEQVYESGSSDIYSVIGSPQSAKNGNSKKPVTNPFARPETKSEQSTRGNGGSPAGNPLSSGGSPPSVPNVPGGNNNNGPGGNKNGNSGGNKNSGKKPSQGSKGKDKDESGESSESEEDNDTYENDSLSQEESEEGAGPPPPPPRHDYPPRSRYDEVENNDNDSTSDSAADDDY